MIKPASIPQLADMKPYKDKLPKLEEGTEPQIITGLPELPITQPEEAPKNLYSLSVANQDLQALLLTISAETGYNVIIDPELTGIVTVDLRDVTLEQLLDSILTPLNFEYKKENGFLKIFKPKTETRIFTLNYVAVTRSGGGGGAAGGGGGAGGGATLGGGGVSSSFQNQVWQDLNAQLESLKSADGQVLIQQATNSIIATDYPANLKKIEQFIKNTESILLRQVMIQAQIIQVVLTNEYQMGIDWRLLSRISPLKLKGATTGGSVIGQSLGSGATPFQFGVINGDFSLLIDAMQHQGQVEILSRPQISVLNNQIATIRAGTNDVFWQTTTQTDPQTGQRTQTATPQSITVGVVLNVVPQISIDGSMTMSIHPSITDKVGVSQSPLGDTAPIVAVQETDTIIKVNDGQTIMIAGLMQDKKSNDVAYVPFLHKLPIIGKAFRKTVENKLKSELVIFLTPTILDMPKPEPLTYGN